MMPALQKYMKQRGGAPGPGMGPGMGAPPDAGMGMAGAPPMQMAPPSSAPPPAPSPGGGPLEKYMQQRGMAGMGQGPRGAGGQPATPEGPGIADPFTEGDQAPALMNPDDAQNEFDPRRRTRPYMGG